MNLSFTGNFSLTDGITASWNLLPAFQLTFSISAALTNAFVLLLFCRNPQLVTSFNIYLVFLLIGNILYSVYVGPLDVINNVYSHWFLGPHWCTAYIYGMNFVQGYVECVHVAITVNRLWAVFFPIHYRQHLTKNIAILIGIGIIVYCHAWILPLIIVDVMYYRLDELIFGCGAHVDGQWLYQAILQFGFFNFSILFVVAAYPVLVYKHFKRGHRRVAQGLATRTADPSGADNKHSATIQTKARKSDRVSHGFLVLTLLTITVIICWVPTVTYFSILLFVDKKFPQVYVIVRMLYYLQTVMDPIYFVFAVRELRVEVKRLLGYTMVID